jgi:hypothetical protein
MTNPLLIMILINCYFIDLMLEQLCRRYKIGPTYNAQASAWMIASLSKKIWTS